MEKARGLRHATEAARGTELDRLGHDRQKASPTGGGLGGVHGAPCRIAKCRVQASVQQLETVAVMRCEVVLGDGASLHDVPPAPPAPRRGSASVTCRRGVTTYVAQAHPRRYEPHSPVPDTARYPFLVPGYHQDSDIL